MEGSLTTEGISKNSEKMVSVDGLPADVLSKVKEVDVKADEIFALRVKLAGFYLKNKQFLPEEQSVDDDEGKVRQRIDGIIKRVDEGESMEDIINWDGSKDWGKGEVKDKFDKLLILTSFNAAIESQRRLNLLESSKFNKDFYRSKYGRLINSKIELDRIEGEIEQLDDTFDAVAKKRLTEGLDQMVVNKAQSYINDKKQSLNEARAKMLSEKPEMYLYYYEMQLKEMHNALDNGSIAETPYVRSRREKVLSSVAIGRPIFIIGELGSGKSEFAKYLSREYLSEKHLAEWGKKNPKPTDEHALVEWESKRKLEMEPLMISGSRELTMEQIIGGRSINKGESLSPEDQLKFIEDKWKEYSKDKSENKEQKELFFEAYREFLKSPVVVKSILGPLTQAMKEGRPLIIDEMNAIPHHLLIMMNDLLTEKPGGVISPMIPGESSFKLKDGFCVLATGNYKPEDRVMYIGRQPVDAAFLSRFDIVKYDYLPNNLTKEDEGLTSEEQRSFRLQNELFQMLMVRLLDDDLSGSFPENSFKQISNLSRVARKTQDIFSGIVNGSDVMADDGANQIPPGDVLKENVLSIRHLLPIIDKWKSSGFTNSLDKYIYDEYVSRSDARPKEKLYLYKLLKVVGGFFDENDGWPSLANVNSVLNFDTGGLHKNIPVIKSFSQVEVIENLFGSKPELREVENKYLIDEGESSVIENNVSQESVSKIEIVDRFSRILDFLIDSGKVVKNYDDFLRESGIGEYGNMEKFLEASGLTDGIGVEAIKPIIDDLLKQRKK